MAYEVTIEARYPRDADTVFAEALNFAELREAMRGLARYDGLPEPTFEKTDRILTTGLQVTF